MTSFTLSTREYIPTYIGAHSHYRVTPVGPFYMRFDVISEKTPFCATVVYKPVESAAHIFVGSAPMRTVPITPTETKTTTAINIIEALSEMETKNEGMETENE